MRLFKLSVAFLLIVFSINASAIERKIHSEISIGKLTLDTQIQLSDDDRHISMVWWIPYEYWMAVFSRDPNIPAAVKNEMLEQLKQYTIIAVVQSDISIFGAFNFYSQEHISKNLNVQLQKGNGKAIKIAPDKHISADMELILNQIKPILQSAMGNLGANFNFFVFNDFDKKGRRIVDPYEKGNITIGLAKKSGGKLTGKINTPLDSLYTPRICPNGKEAHVSWGYCPWSGKKLNN